MGKRTLVWGLLWILSLVGISFFGGPISYGFFALMTLIPAVAWLYLFLVFICFRIYQKAGTNTLTVGKPVDFYFTLVNEFPLVFAGVRVRFFTSFSYINGLSDETEYELWPGTGIKKETELICKYRGEYEVGIKRVEIQDYLRLFKLSYRNRESLRVTVKPRLVYLDTLKSVNISNLLREAAKKKDTPDVLTRAYVSGDDVRRINWKQTATVGSLMVRELSGEEKRGIGIITDTSRVSKDEAVYLPIENKILETVLALALFMCGKGIPTHEVHYDGAKAVLDVESLNTFDNFYEAVSGISFDGENTTKNLLDAVTGDPEMLSLNAVFLVVHSFDAYIKSIIELLNKNDTFIVIYLIDHDKENGEDISLINLPRTEMICLSDDDDIKEVL